jgi:hypothetical protein
VIDSRRHESLHTHCTGDGVDCRVRLADDAVATIAAAVAGDGSGIAGGVATVLLASLAAAPLLRGPAPQLYPQFFGGCLHPGGTVDLRGCVGPRAVSLISLGLPHTL